MQIAPVVPDVAPGVAGGTTVVAQVALVGAKVTPLSAGSGGMAASHVLAGLRPVVSYITPVPSAVAPVLPQSPVVLPQVPAVVPHILRCLGHPNGAQSQRGAQQ